MTEPVPSADFPHLSLGVSLAAPDNCDSSTPGLLPAFDIAQQRNGYGEAQSAACRAGVCEAILYFAE